MKPVALQAAISFLVHQHNCMIFFNLQFHRRYYFFHDVFNVDGLIFEFHFFVFKHGKLEYLIYQ